MFIFSGDFKQMLPVIPHANKYTVMSMCLNKSELWKFMKKFKLSTNMRLQVSDENNFQQLIDFATYLNNIGHGTEQTIDHNDLIRLPDIICINNNNLDSLIEFVYPNFINNYNNEDFFKDRAILATKNKTVHTINHHILSKIKSEIEITYYSSDKSKIDESDNKYPIEYLNSYESNNLPSHELKLKINAIVMCMRNLRVHTGIKLLFFIIL